MDAYFFNSQGAFQPSLFKVYNRIRNKILYSLSTYIQMNKAYSYKNEPILMDIINSPEYYIQLKEQWLVISKECFEKHIPDYQAGLAYVNLYQQNAIFYTHPQTYKGDSSSYIMIIDDVVVLFFDRSA